MAGAVCGKLSGRAWVHDNHLIQGFNKYRDIPIMNIKYTGMLDVEPNAFSLEVARMISMMRYRLHGRNYETGIPWEFSG